MTETEMAPAILEGPEEAWKDEEHFTVTQCERAERAALARATHHHQGNAHIIRAVTPTHTQYVTVFILHRAYSIHTF